ncbi:HAMP domain-containing histidine kinase [Clostridium sp. MSJ-4]|uniref:histidine kinase n=1 Tax=Clostridium simiarum TaxID=2841506 RepID=A0ABS6F0E6_9CLOT|nr:HAMP domain-containing sensor histidine kinase [Clostridium simiarum]MBU5591972.1 HAMP domain-containing histidine kinase [Clostridium simiarum]
MGNLFRNPEIKSFTYKFLFLYITLMISTLLIFNFQLNQLNKEYINQNIALAGKILSENPELEKDIIHIFTKSPTVEEISKGKEILNKYGYTDELSLNNTNTFKELIHSLNIKIPAYISFILLIFFFLVAINYKKIYDKINLLSEQSEKIIKGNFDISLFSNGEGDMQILSHNFNEMAKIIKHNIENLNKEKIFLKNIISDISHQLKTPLSSLMMFNEILLTEEHLDEKKQRSFLQQSNKQLIRMEWLIINLLKLMRLESGSIEFEMKKNNLKETLQIALSSLKLNSKNKNQNLIVNVAEINFNHDINWTAEALSNIIKNSIEHTPENGTIEISTEETPVYVQINIKDSGNGIKEKDINRIFERFYKGRNSVNPTSIGIGLSLSKIIIESQNGNIYVTSKENQGTEFNIIFLKHVI